MTISFLRWSIALVLGSGAALLLLSLAHGGHPGVPDAIAGALGVAELVAALLFLVPRTTALGGIALVGVLAAAAVLHIAIGEVPPPSFVVYAAGIAVVMRSARREVVS